MRKRVIACPVGSSIRLKCMASGNPRPEIEWLKDDRLLTEQEVGEGRQKKWTLSLRNLGPEQSGRYTCKVTNRAGEINATYKVEVIRECRFPRTTNQVEKGSKVKCHVLDGRVRNFFYVRLKKKKSHWISCNYTQNNSI